MPGVPGPESLCDLYDFAEDCLLKHERGEIHLNSVGLNCAQRRLFDRNISFLEVSVFGLTKSGLVRSGECGA